jgi:pyridoxine/pyridoxamine 5'-phosphate oxidase
MVARVTQSNSTDYYRSRERQERVLAQAAKDPAVIAIHLEMAEQYSRLARGSARGMTMILNRVM